MRYGVPYKGSKNAIATWIIDNLPAGNRFVDLFAGGGAVTHAALLSDKWKYFVANDIDGSGLQLFIDAIHGKYKNENRWISREDFFRLKDTDPYVRWCWSFGNDGKTYMYGREIEAYKEAVHKEMLSEARQDRYIWHKKAVAELKKIIESKLDASDKSLKHLQSLENLERLQSLERLESSERLESLERLEIYKTDYRDFNLSEGDIVYCDIPYKGTDPYNGQKFNHDEFYEWASKQSVPVYISEYNVDDERFAVAFEKERCGRFSAKNNAHRVNERIYKVA